MNQGNVLGVQFVGEYPCGSPMEHREGPWFGEHWEDIPVLGRPSEVEGTLPKMQEPLPESTVQPGGSCLGHLHFPLASGIKLVGSSGFCPQICQALQILGGCPSHGTQQITHVCCHLESQNRVLPSTCCGLPPSPPWPPTSSPLCVGGHRGENA